MAPFPAPPAAGGMLWRVERPVKRRRGRGDSGDPGSRAAAPRRGRDDSGSAEGPSAPPPASSLSPRTERSDDPGSRAAPRRCPGPRLSLRSAGVTVVGRKAPPLLPASSLSPRTERSRDPGSRATAPRRGRGDSGGAEGPAAPPRIFSVTPDGAERRSGVQSRTPPRPWTPALPSVGRGDSGGAEGPAALVPASSLSPRTERSDDPGSRATAPRRGRGDSGGAEGPAIFSPRCVFPGAPREFQADTLPGPAGPARRMEGS